MIVLFFSLMIVAGRIMQQENDVRSAAEAGARAASLRNDAAEAVAVADRVVNDNLQQTGVSCDGGPRIQTRSVPDHSPGGVVEVTVECTARTLGSLGLAPVDFDHIAVEVIDEFRGAP